MTGKKKEGRKAMLERQTLNALNLVRDVEREAGGVMDGIGEWGEWWTYRKAMLERLSHLRSAVRRAREAVLAAELPGEKRDRDRDAAR